MSACNVDRSDTNMYFNVVSITGRLAVGKSDMESCNSLVSSRDESRLTSRPSSEGSFIFCLLLAGLEEADGGGEKPPFPGLVLLQPVFVLEAVLRCEIGPRVCSSCSLLPFWLL